MTNTMTLPNSSVASEPCAEFYPHTVHDVQITPFNSEGRSPQFVIKGPGDQAYLRTNETGVRLLELLDGTRSLDAIQLEFAHRYSQSISREKILSFLQLCAQNNLLRPGSWPGTDIAGQARPPRKSIKFYRRLISNDRLASWLVQHRRWWLNPLTIVLGLALMLFGLGWLLFAQHPVSMVSVLYQIDPQGTNAFLLWLPVIFLIEVCLHEIGHSLACRLAGVPAGGFGVGLWWGIVPVFFTDTRAVYTIDNKYRRASVSLAGPLVDLMALGVVSLAIWLTPAGSPGQRLAIAFHGLLLIVMLVNLNPFLIRMDGYWILTDLIEAPNLRQITVRMVLVRLLTLLRRPIPPELTTGLPHQSRRWRWLSFIYGCIAISWTLIFLITFVLSFISSLQTALAF